MANTFGFRDTHFGGQYPSMGTFDVAANTFIPKGTIVTLNASGYAVGDGSGVVTVGVAAGSINNLTGSPDYSGLAGGARVQTVYGIHAFDCADTPLPGDVMYVVDNQTVTSTPNGGAVAGTYHETDVDGRKYLYMAPSVPRTLGSVNEGTMPVDVSNLRQASGVIAVAFADGSADGYVVNEGLMHRWNVGSTNVRHTQITLPEDLDDAQPIVLHCLCSREGSADTTAALTVGAFFAPAGAAYTADSNAGGDTTAVSAATTVVQEVTLTLAAADVPAGPCVLNLSFVPTAALDADDLNLHGAWITFARKG